VNSLLASDLAEASPPHPDIAGISSPVKIIAFFIFLFPSQYIQ
jgi:hypothetical protein